MSGDLVDMTVRVVVALAAGGAIGYERSYRGRAAGFRTHALVSMASAILMLLATYESHWTGTVEHPIRIDPTRMAQGIMTGIGFLGAGAIVREGLTVRGLTTAASVWITAAVGILAGTGFYFPLLVSVVLTLGVLAVFRRLEAHLPTQAYYRFEAWLTRDAPCGEEELRRLAAAHGFTTSSFGFRLDGEAGRREYSTRIASTDRDAAGRLAQALAERREIHEFRIAPTAE